MSHLDTVNVLSVLAPLVVVGHSGDVGGAAGATRDDVQEEAADAGVRGCRVRGVAVQQTGQGVNHLQEAKEKVRTPYLTRD